MFDRIIDIIVQGWSAIRPWFVVDVYEKAGVLRFGGWNRAANPGKLHWKWPFIEKVIEITACVTTVRLPAQYLTTKDDFQVALAAIVKYEVKDVEPYITGIYDQHDVLCDVTMGAIRRYVAEQDYADLVQNPPEDKVATAVRRKANKYGFEIHEVTFTSFTRARPFMLISQSVFKELDN
jgi:regulator of protease activity HflC (stomatin/prohibitin superfamily)